jgi:signal transduction histidine kinase
MRFGVQTISYAVAAANFFFIGGWLLHRSKRLHTYVDEAYESFVLFSCGLWMLFHVLERVSLHEDAKLLWDNLEYAGIALISTAWIVYASQYTGYVGKTARKIWITGSILSISALALVATNDNHHLIWRDAMVQYDSGVVIKTYAIGYYIIISYFAGVCTASSLFMLKYAATVSRSYKSQTKLIPLFALLPIAFVFMEKVLGINLVESFQLTPIAFSISIWLIFFTLPVAQKSDLLTITTDAVMEKMHDAVFVLNDEGRLIDLNLAALKSVGLKYKQEALGRSLGEIWGEDNYLEITKKNGGSVQREGRYFDPVVSDVADTMGTLISRVVVLRDITERYAGERAALSFAQKLQARNEELRQFSYAAGHDLQEPLRMVSNYLGLLEKRYNDVFDRNAREFVAYASDGAKRMETLLDALLSYSRIGTTNLGIEQVDLAGVLEDVSQNLKLAIERAGARIEYQSLPSVMADRTQLVQLLQNLVSNAIKFRCLYQRPVIKIDAEKQGDVFHVTVNDNGIGISADQHDRIFKIFQRLHTKDEYDGSGIGLAICKRIVERHGGDIWMESSQDIGTMFHFTLPIVGRI